jgi:hypothetical protein
MEDSSSAHLQEELLLQEVQFDDAGFTEPQASVAVLHDGGRLGSGGADDPTLLEC